MDDVLDRAAEALAARRWADALRLAHEVLEEPDSDTLLLLQAHLHAMRAAIGLRRPGLAERHAAQAAAFGQDVGGIWAVRGRWAVGNARAKLGKPQEAVEEYRSALSLLQDLPNAEQDAALLWFNVGACLQRLRRWEESDAALQQSILTAVVAGDSQTQFTAAQNLLCNLLQSGRLDMAYEKLIDLQRAIIDLQDREWHDRAAVHLQLQAAYYYAQRGDFERAELLAEPYTRSELALARYWSPQAHSVLAYVAAACGNRVAADRHLQRAYEVAMDVFPESRDVLSVVRDQIMAFHFDADEEVL